MTASATSLGTFDTIARNVPPQLRFESSGTAKRAWGFLQGITQDAYRTWSCKDSYLLTEAEIEEKSLRNQKLLRVITSLSRTSYLKRECLEVYGDFLRSQFPFFKLIPSCASSTTLDIDSLPTLSKVTGFGKRLLAFPVTVRGVFVNHAMVVLIDLEHARVEFYDSKGLRAADRKGEKLLCSETCTLVELITRLSMRYLPSGCTYIENTAKHQNDGFNCVVYVSEYCRRRCSGESAEGIFESGSAFEDISRQIRLQMIEDMSTAARKQAEKKGPTDK